MVDIDVYWIMTLLLLGSLPEYILGGEGFYNIAHMTNNVFAVDWAIKQGANAIEVDLQFKADGTPYAFFHAPQCDCTCMCNAGSCNIFYPNSVCVQLEKSSQYPCYARTDKAKLLNYIVYRRFELVMIMIDSKLTDDDKKMSDTTQRKAAENVIEMLEMEVFLKGWRGEVIIGAPNFQSFVYIEHLARLLTKKTRFEMNTRVHFTIDQEPAIHTKKWLDFSFNKNLVYNVGLSTCSPYFEAYEKLSKLAAINKAKGLFGMTYTWTVDKHSTLEYYTRYFNGIITNYPGSLTKVLKQKGIKLATSDDRIPEARQGLLEMSASNYTCECSYSKGGCRITKVAPKGLACHCKYSFLWTCTGATVVQCINNESSYCTQPDLSKDSCVQGGGECGGYKD